MTRRLLFIVCLVACSRVQAATFDVKTAADIESAQARAKPGDQIVLADGDWHDQVIRVKAHGEAEKPITLRAATPGKVVLSGKSSIAMEGDELVLKAVSISITRAAMATASSCMAIAIELPSAPSSTGSTSFSFTSLARTIASIIAIWPAKPPSSRDAANRGGGEAPGS